MKKYIPVDKLIAEIKRFSATEYADNTFGDDVANGALDYVLEEIIPSLQQEQPEANEIEKASSLQIQAYLTTASDELYAPGKPLYTKEHHEGIHECMNMWQKLHRYYFSTKQEYPDNIIQWTGNNLKEIIDFTGKSLKFGEWFKSWEEYENYVHSHNDILKLFFNDGSHYEVPVGAWIVKTPDGYNVPSVAKYVQQEQSEMNLVTEYDEQFYSDPVFGKLVNRNAGIAIARHFYELGLNARKEE